MMLSAETKANASFRLNLRLSVYLINIIFLKINEMFMILTLNYYEQNKKCQRYFIIALLLQTITHN